MVEMINLLKKSNIDISGVPLPGRGINGGINY